MPVLTLTTDLGLKDYYVGALKGAVYKEMPDAVIVDISHQVDPFDLIQASFIIKHAFKEFPKNSVHIIGVDTEHSLTLQPLAVLAGDHYFVGPDNGIFSLIFDKIPDKWKIEFKNIKTNFSSRRMKPFFKKENRPANNKKK